MTGERENEIRELMLRLPIGDTRKAISHLLLEVEDERAKLAKARAAIAAIVDARARYIHAPGGRLAVIAQVDEILVNALKEIS